MLPMDMDAVDQLMQAGVVQGVFPGAVLQVTVNGAVIFNQAYGWADIFSDRAMTGDTLFDLASLTKPLATTLAVMALVGRGRMDLDEPCVQICPELTGTDKAEITIRQLLNHSSGLPAWRPFFMRLQGCPATCRLPELRRMLLNEPLNDSPGQRSEYSDLGFMLLHWMVERVAQASLERYVFREIYHPLGIGRLFYGNPARPAFTPQRYAATQLCPWRNRLLIGEVDDENAWISGGVAGHAGLFGTAEAVGQLLGALVAADQADDGKGVFDPDLVRVFFNTHPRERWALGFDTPSAQGSSAGRFFPADSIGHLGFTGGSFWIHRRQRVIVVLLTNRVHPFRFRVGIKSFRPRLHDAVMVALGRGGGG